MSARVCIKVKSLRTWGCPCCGKKFNTLEEWVSYEDYKGEKPHVYVGRHSPYVKGAAQSKFANPFRIGKKHTREDVLKKYREHLRSDPELRKQVMEELKGKAVGCFCDIQEECHCDVLLEMHEEN